MQQIPAQRLEPVSNTAKPQLRESHAPTAGRNALLEGIQKGVVLRAAPPEESHAPATGRNALLEGIQKGVHLKPASVSAAAPIARKESVKDIADQLRDELEKRKNAMTSGDSESEADSEWED
jgi:hypothetical protein